MGYGKTQKWVVTPKPGSHKKKETIPLLLILRDMLGLADNAREAKKILKDGHILVDGIPRRSYNFSVGLMDVISIPKIKKQYLFLPSKKGLYLKETTDDEAKVKFRRIIGKTTLKGKKTQIILHDGKTLLADKSKYGVGDTLVQELSSGKITKVLEFKKGNTALVAYGVHSGEVGKIVEVIPGTSTRKSLTKVGELQTLSDYLFVIGESKPIISL
jgi:small subunit ribosomal protein S4e